MTIKWLPDKGGLCPYKHRVV